ncbi:unnamed protein product, partial [Mesorhabditis belari]|uniref:RNA helicase n=1 Tax=Mesorhabditis belari TaxID=2138241 RepID=A0AAF3EW73_9BILA
MSKWQEQFRAQMMAEGMDLPIEPPADPTSQLVQQTQSLGLGAGGDYDASPTAPFYQNRGGYRGRGRGRGRGSRGGFDSSSFSPQQQGGFNQWQNQQPGTPNSPNNFSQRGGGFVQQGNFGGYPTNQFDDQSPRGGYQNRGGRGGNWRGGFQNATNYGGGQQFAAAPAPQLYQNATNFQQSPQKPHGSPRGSPRGFFPNISKRFDSGAVRPLAGFTGNLPEKSAEEATPPENPMSSEDLALLNKFLQRTVEHMREGTVDVKNQQQDPTSPLHSILNFRELRVKDDIIKALDMMGFEQPSKIQEFALPLLLMEPPTNMIAQSQSGTGKTAAFVLTMLSRVVPENKYPQALCLAPTHELAKQIGKVVNDMSRFMPDVKVHFAVKGQMADFGTSLTEQIVIGTPGKLDDYIFKFKTFDISKVKCVVLDEADVMLWSNPGHKEISLKIYNAIQKVNPKCQALLFSATYEEEVIKFAEQLIKDAVLVTLRKEEQALPNIKQFYVECASRDAKFEAIFNLYTGLTIASAIIFCHTIQSAKWIAHKLCEKGLDVGLLHGQLSVEERATAIQQFREGHYKVMITTNVCARGIDVSQVSIVINYDPPVRQMTGANGAIENVADFETYLHRIGRTGRFGKSGIAINLVDSKQTLKYIEDIENYFEKPIVKLEPADLEQLEAIENEDKQGDEEEE